MRPGCDRPAAARLAFDPVALQLWLDPLGTRSAPVQELCDFHIERLTIPRGWSATDRRPGPSVSGIEPLPASPVPPPVVEPPPEPVVQPPPEPVVEPVVVTPAPEPIEMPEPEPVVASAPAPAPIAEPVAVPAPAAAPDPVIESPAPPARKRPAARTRRPAAASTESSLLSRAFAWTGPQQSILTQGRTDGDGSNDPDDA